MPEPWTRPADVRDSLRKKWPALLEAFMAGEQWAPLSVPLRGPAPAAIGERLGEVQQWMAYWAPARSGRGPLRVEYKKVGGRHIGTNEIPCRAWLDGYDQAWALLGTRDEVRRLTGLAELTKAECPRLLPWLVTNPVRVLRLADDWGRLAATVRWIEQRQRPGMYLRQVDVPGVDTKFIGRHKGVLSQLLNLQLDPSRIKEGETDFEGRYGFARKPAYVRFRSAAPALGHTELAVRVAEFAARPPAIRRVFVVENEITYLAFPLPPDAIVIFGGGYAAEALQSLTWLADLDMVYWGDLDTHGFAILNRLRRRFPHVRSMLMDRATLLAHESQWVAEPSQATAVPEELTAEELACYQDLVSGVFGPTVRLEQERVSFSALERALLALG
jgi:hypothetical protein